jgi:colicin import membrane protein
MRLRNVLAFAFLAASGVALGQDLNFISAVDVRDEGATVVVSVRGSKPPNFTTFSMADPPRFVIDFSEAKFQGVPEELPPGSTLVRAVKNLSYGSDATSIARILIAFTADVDPPDVETQGTSLVVRIDKPASAAGIAVAQADTAAQRAREQGDAQARADAERQAAEEATARSKADAEAELRASAQRQAQEAAEAQARADAERRALDEAQAKAAQDAAAKSAKSAEEARLAGARGVEADAERLRLEALAAVGAGAAKDDQDEAERKAETKRQREEAIAAAKAESEKKKLAEVERKAEAKRQREEAIAAAKAEGEKRKLEEADRKAEAKRQRAEARLALAQARDEAQPRDEALQAAAPPSQLREIGFRQMPGVSRVFVRTSGPPRFSIQDVGENMIRVELENTRVTRRNDGRFLDTSFFASAVALITPSRRGSSYVVDIKLKEKVPYQQRIEGDMLALDFERPASGTASAPVPGEPPFPGGVGPAR